MNAVTVAVLAIAVLGVVSAPSRASDIDRDFHQSFEVSEGFRLELNSGDGDVMITPWDKDVIDVSVRCRAEVVRVGTGGPPDFTVDFEAGDDFVKVTGRMLPSGPSIFQSLRFYEYRYLIKAPAWVKLEVNGDDGDVKISGWRSEVDCSLGDGDLLLEDVAGPTTRVSLDDGDVTGLGVSGELRIAGDDGDVKLTGCDPIVAKFELEDGDVEVSDSSGGFDVSVDDGDVNLALTRASEVRVRAADGDVSVAVAGGPIDNVEIETDDGDVVASMPAGASYSFRIQTDDGHVSVDLPESEGIMTDEHMAMGSMRGGKGSLRIKTSDGDVRLVER